MPFLALRLGLAFTLAGCALCQERPDPSAYAYFFADVASLKSTPTQNSDNSPTGDGVVPVAAKIQDVIGISAAEVEILRRMAADCIAAIDSLQAPKRDLIFDSRLEFIETGKHSETLEKKLKELDDRADELVVSYVGRLRAALQAASFEKIDTYVHTPFRDRKSLAVMVMVRKPDPMAGGNPAVVMVKK